MSKIKFDLSDRNNMFYWQTNRKISAEDMKTVFLDRKNTVSNEDTIAAIEYGMQQAGKSENDSKVVNIGEPIPFGSVNNVMKATLADKTEVVVRMHPYHVQNGYFWAEKVAVENAIKQGVLTFRTYFIDDSKKVFDFDFMIMEALPGKTMQSFWPIDAKTDAVLIYETGKQTALIHKVHPKGYGFFNNKIAKDENRLQGQYNSFKDHFYAGLDEDFKFLVNSQTFTKKQQSSIEKIFIDNEKLLKCETPSLIHNDIADWNQLSDGKHITGMIDWDESFSGDPIMDFAQWSLFFDDARLAHFIKGYESITKLPSNYEEKLHLFRLRYLVSKMHLRKKRVLITDSKFMNDRIKRAMEVMEEEFEYFGV